MNIQEIKMPKFLLAEEPTEPADRFTYIYSPRYMSLILVIEENSQIAVLNYENDQKPQKLFVYDEVEQFRFVIIQNNVEATGGILAPAITPEQFLDEAWQWYKNYLIWEDNNIDAKEKGKWN